MHDQLRVRVLSRCCRWSNVSAGGRTEKGCWDAVIFESLRHSVCLRSKLPVLKTVGVVDIVGGGQRPEPIPDEEIAALQTLMTNVLPYDPHPYLQEGMQVEVVRGPLQGVRGILLRKEKRHRLVLGVRLIQQAAAVEIDITDVVPA